MPFIAYFVLVLLCSSKLFCAHVEAELSQGYRRDNLTYTISGSNGHPNILSELRFKHIDLYMSSIALKVNNKGYFINVMGAYGHVLHGTVRDRDFFADNRKMEFSDSHHDITGDYTIDAQMLIGKEFIPTAQMHISPLIGFGYYQQKFRLRHGQIDRTIGFLKDEKYYNVKTHNLNSTYRAAWYSPQIGVNIKKELMPNITMSGQYLFLYPLHYHANGFWNKRERHSQYFKQENKPSRSFGNIITVGCSYKLADKWNASVEFEEMLFYAKDGSCIRNHHKTNPFRKAKRNASEFRLALSYLF